MRVREYTLAYQRQRISSPVRLCMIRGIHCERNFNGLAEKSNESSEFVVPSRTNITRLHHRLPECLDIHRGNTPKHRLLEGSYDFSRNRASIFTEWRVSNIRSSYSATKSLRLRTIALTDDKKTVRAKSRRRERKAEGKRERKKRGKKGRGA